VLETGAADVTDPPFARGKGLVPTSTLDALIEHLEDVRRWCRRRSRDVHLADDVAQETALIALTRLSTLRDPDRVRGWLFRVAQRRMADEVRRRRALLPLTHEPPAPLPYQPVDRSRATAVRRALRTLPLFLRRPMRMHYLKGQPIREIAATLDTTINGIKARLYRARRLLRDEATLR